jgi:hypothetical protein
MYNLSIPKPKSLEMNPIMTSDMLLTLFLLVGVLLISEPEKNDKPTTYP